MEKIIKKEFGQWLRDTRMEQGYTLRKFAKIINTSPTYISNIERNLKLPSEKILTRIAGELGQNEDMVLGMAGKISPELTDIITDNPLEAAKFLKETKGMSKQSWDRIIEIAKNSQK